MAEIGLVIAYLAVSFVLTALTVRAGPHSRIGRAIRRRYWLFPAVPVLWILALVFGAGSLARTIRKQFKRLFEGVSGHRTYVPLNQYNYYRGETERPLEPAE